MVVLTRGLVLLVALALFVGCEPSGSDAADDQRSSSPEQDEVAALSAAIVDNPNSPEAYFARAQYHFDRENFADAVYDMASAMQLDSINEDYHLFLAEIYLQSYQSELALATVERSVRLFPESNRSWLKAAEYQIILRQYQQAAASIQRILERAPQHVEALQLLGVLFKEQGDNQRAIQSFQTVVELDSDNFEAWTMLGNLMDIEGDPLALQCFDNAIAIDSTYPQGWHSKAFYLQNHEQVDEAIAIYHRLHRIDSTYAPAYLNAGILYLEKSEFDNAESELNAYQRLEPYDPMAPFYLGVLAEAREDYRTALTFYNKAASLSPRNARFGQAVESMRIRLGE